MTVLNVECRVCARCGEPKPLGREFWQLAGWRGDGTPRFRSICKSCRSAARRGEVRLPVEDRAGYVDAAPLVGRVIAPALRDACAMVGVAADDATDLQRALTGIDLRGALGPVEQVAADLGVSAKTIRQYVTGHYQMLSAKTLDRILTNSDRLWWEVYEPGDPGYEDARRLLGDG